MNEGYEADRARVWDEERQEERERKKKRKKREFPPGPGL